MFNKVETDLNFIERENKVKSFWKENQIFEKSIEARAQGTPYVFYDGPPTANGKPHIGHVLARVFKDMVPRYRAIDVYKRQTFYTFVRLFSRRNMRRWWEK